MHALKVPPSPVGFWFPKARHVLRFDFGTKSRRNCPGFARRDLCTTLSRAKMVDSKRAPGRKNPSLLSHLSNEELSQLWARVNANYTSKDNERNPSPITPCRLWNGANLERLSHTSPRQVGNQGPHLSGLEYLRVLSGGDRSRKPPLSQKDLYQPGASDHRNYTIEHFSQWLFRVYHR